MAGPGAAAGHRCRVTAEAPANPAARLVGRCTFPPAGTPLVCAVSGGADSLALLVLAVAAGCRVTAVHVDHRLRPESSAESAVVVDAARRYGAEVRCVAAPVARGANEEARARSARRAALGSDAATGHTMDDQAETVLINLLRGAGTDGLAAMRPGVVHPLLGLRRSETRALCAAEGLQPVLDPSNQDLRYLRNRVRHQLLPLCSAMAGRDLVPVLARQAAVLAGESDLLQALAAAVDPTDSRGLAGIDPALARRAVRHWLRAGQPYPPDLASVDRVLAVARGAVRATEVAGGRRVSRRAGRLRVEPALVGGSATGGPTVEPALVGQPDTHRRPVVSPADGLPGSGDANGSVKRLRSRRAEPLMGSRWDDDPHLGEVVVPQEALARRVSELGAALTEEYRGEAPLLVGVLKGAFIFLSDLARAIELPIEFDVMAVASYGSGTTTSGVVRIVKDLDADLTGRHVVVVEDIVDSGLTLSYLRRYLLARQPASLQVCALLVKETRQQATVDLAHVGFRIPPDFVVGYGLDVAERYRNLADIRRYVGPVPVD